MSCVSTACPMPTADVAGTCPVLGRHQRVRTLRVAEPDSGVGLDLHVRVDCDKRSELRDAPLDAVGVLAEIVA